MSSEKSLLVASNVEDYVLYRDTIVRPESLPQNAPPIADNQYYNRKNNLTRTSLPHVVIWRAFEGEEGSGLDPLQTHRVRELSKGKTFNAMAERHGGCGATEGNHLRSIRKNWGVGSRASTVIAGICLENIVNIEPDTDYSGCWLVPDELKLCRSVGLDISERILARNRGISVQAIRTRFSRLYDKIGAENRPHAMRRLFEIGQFQRYVPGLTDTVTFPQTTENP